MTSLAVVGPAMTYGMSGMFSQLYITLEGRYMSIINAQNTEIYSIIVPVS